MQRNQTDLTEGGAAVDKPPPVNEGEESRSTEMKRARREQKEAAEEDYSSSDESTLKHEQHSFGTKTAERDMEEEEEEVEPPGRQMLNLQIPDFLQSDAPEGTAA